MLDCIKELTRGLLYVEPTPDEAYPFFVHHPFFENDMTFDGDGFFKLFDDLDRARKPYDELIDQAGNIAELLMLVRDPYKMLWFKLASPYIRDDEEYADVLKHCWISEEWPSRDVNVSMDEIIELFRGANRNLMVPENFPDKLRVYRGVNRGGSPLGMSWTIAHQTATWFATRFGHEGQVYELEVPKDKILAYIEERGENEVVVDTRGLEEEIIEV